MQLFEIAILLLLRKILFALKMIPISEIMLMLQRSMVVVLSLKDSAQTVADIRRKALRAYAAKMEDAPSEDKILTRMNMAYKNPHDGTIVFFDVVRRDIKGELDLLDMHQNRQYQWLLAEAYEAFEDFIEHLYANAGFNDIDFWEHSHLNGAEGRAHTWEWLLERANSSKLDAEKIMKQFRKKLPDFSLIEVDNAIGIDLRFTLESIAQMRHHIVHTKGEVRNQEVFSKKILDKFGRWNNGKPSNYREEIDDLFFLPPHNTVIALLERPVKHDHGLPLQMDVMQNFCRCLLSTARALSDALIRHQQERA